MDDVGQTLLNWASAFGTQEMVKTRFCNFVWYACWCVWQFISQCLTIAVAGGVSLWKGGGCQQRSEVIITTLRCLFWTPTSSQGNKQSKNTHYKYNIHRTNSVKYLNLTSELSLHESAAVVCICFWMCVFFVQTLLRHGANPDLRDEDGKTPLDKARERGHSEVVAILQSPG